MHVIVRQHPHVGCVSNVRHLSFVAQKKKLRRMHVEERKLSFFLSSNVFVSRCALTISFEASVRSFVLQTTCMERETLSRCAQTLQRTREDARPRCVSKRMDRSFEILVPQTFRRKNRERGYPQERKSIERRNKLEKLDHLFLPKRERKKEQRRVARSACLLGFAKQERSAHPRCSTRGDRRRMARNTPPSDVSPSTSTKKKYHRRFSSTNPSEVDRRYRR